MNIKVLKYVEEVIDDDMDRLVKYIRNNAIHCSVPPENYARALANRLKTLFTEGEKVLAYRKELEDKVKSAINKFHNKHGIMPSHVRIGYMDNVFEGKHLFEHGSYIDEDNKIVLLVSRSKSHICEASLL